MIKKVLRTLKSQGINGLVRALYWRLMRRRLHYFDQCRSLFHSRVGLEIGGPSEIFTKCGHIPIYPLAARIDNCNFSNHTVWDGRLDEGDTFVFNRRKSPGKQYIAEASNLRCFEDASYDFVLASHCIEHLANPLNGLAEWIRVLRHNGLLVLVFPHRDGTFDHLRPVTSLEHIIQDQIQQTGEEDMTHLAEILALHDLKRDPGVDHFESFKARSLQNLENRCLHHHVFDTRLAVEVVNHMGLRILTVELFRPYHIVILAIKTLQDETAYNECFRGVSTAPCWSSPFPSDRITVSNLTSTKPEHLITTKCLNT